MRRTLAWQLAARYLLVLAALLLASAAFQYVALRHFLVAAAGERLRAEARQPAAAYAAVRAGGATPGPTAAQDLVLAVVGPQTTAWVVGPRGGVLAEAAGPGQPAPPFARSQPRPGQSPAPGVPPGRLAMVGADLVLAMPLGPRPGPGPATLILATPVADVLAVLASEVRLLLAGGFGALLLGGASGTVAVRQALRPLRAITAAADRITGGDLQVRAGQADAPEEVAHLARAFDAMVDRLAASIAEERATHRQMRRFLDDASHELRTPLAALCGTLEVLQGEAGADPDAVREGLRAAYRQARRLGGLAGGLLALARVERPDGLPLEPADLGGVLAAIRPAAERLAADHRLWWVAQPQPLPVLANAEVLGAAVLNVVENAVRYSPIGSDIRVEARRAGGAAEIVVADHGQGIPAECLPHVFDRFYRCPARPEEGAAPPGTGLGLAIVRSVMERHRGAAAIESEVGAGTTVRLTLPLGAGTARGGEAGPL